MDAVPYDKRNDELSHSQGDKLVAERAYPSDGPMTGPPVEWLPGTGVAKG